MKRTLERILYLALLLLLSVAGCDEAEITQTLNDITSDAYAGMVLIPAGEVWVGLSQNQLDIYNEQYNVDTTLNDHTTARNSALPSRALAHQKVHVDAFYMDKYEVTWEQHLDFARASGYESERATQTLKIFPDLVDKSGYFGKKPITQLSVAEMEAYAEFYGKQLPTEIEWEKAARGGLVDNNYPWGNQITPEDANYNHEDIRNFFIPDGSGGYTAVKTTASVGQYPPNGYGLYDMAGNVAEYVDSDWNERDGSVNHVLYRGGDYRRPGYECQNWYRNYNATGRGHGTIGFRCIKRF